MWTRYYANIAERNRGVLAFAGLAKADPTVSFPQPPPAIWELACLMPTLSWQAGAFYLAFMGPQRPDPAAPLAPLTPTGTRTYGDEGRRGA